MDFLAETGTHTEKPWKLLLIDDEPEVHEVTRLVLASFRFEGKPLQFLSAYNVNDAKRLLQTHDDIAVTLLDVVMETETAGLELVKYIRDELHNHQIRIVLRTGQPGQAPEHEVISNYDINDYKEKTELTSQKMATVMFASLRAYRDIMTIEANKVGLERVLAASSHIFSHEKSTEFASAVLSQLTALVGMERGALYCKLANTKKAEPESLLVAAATGDYAKYVNHRADEGLPAHILKTLKSACENKKHQFQHDHYVLHFTDTLHSESLLYVGETWDLSELDYKLVEVFCTNVSIGFENLHLNQELVEAQMEMICVLAGAAESRSQETAAHVRRVGVLAELLGRLSGLSDQEAEALRHAAPLHDIGKIGIPDAILNKPGSHTPDETEIMRTHAAIGHQMLSQSKRGIFIVAAEIAATHHENWDGSGYPLGLKGDAIPLPGRITMLADVFDALGSKRCYKDPWPSHKIKDFIQEQSGIKFDPQLVELLFKHWDEAELVRAQLPD
jgi:response regulator RpfG family c-di-GMP phosphodiesterase